MRCYEIGGSLVMDSDSDAVTVAAASAAAALLHLQEQFSDAQGHIAAKNVVAAESTLRDIVFTISPSDGDECTKVREKSVIALGNLYVSHGQIVKLQQLLEEIRPLFNALPKAKTAKIVRTLIDLMSNVPGSEQLQVQVCRDSIQWCTVEKRAFLRQRVQSKLASLLLKTKDYTNCNALLTELLSEVIASCASRCSLLNVWCRCASWTTSRFSSRFTWSSRVCTTTCVIFPDRELP